MAKALVQDKKISEIAHREVVWALREILSDPDFGLSLKASAIRRLKLSLRSKEVGNIKPVHAVLEKFRA